MAFFLHLLIVIAIYSVLALALDLVAGQAGLLSVAQAAFFGLGAYASALLTTRLGLPPWLAALIGLALAALASLAVSLPALELRDDYFILASFAVQVAFTSVATNWLTVTRGPLGVPNVPEVRFFGLDFSEPGAFLGLAAVVLAFAFLVVAQLSASPFGRALRLLREDEVLARAFGKSPAKFKIPSVAVSAGLSALAGSLYAHYFAYVDPSSFTVSESILVLSMVVVGGADSRTGPLLGATLLVAIPEALRFVGMPPAAAGNLRQILYASLLVGILLIRPQGVTGRIQIGRA